MLLSAAALSMPLAAEIVSMTVPTGMPYWSSVALLSYRVLRICSQNMELKHWLPLLQSFHHICYAKQETTCAYMCTHDALSCTRMCLIQQQEKRLQMAPK